MARQALATLAALGLLSAGCAPKGEITAAPTRLIWERVDFEGFPDDMPEEGYESQNLVLTNSGSVRVDLVINDFDFSRLCLQGYTDNPVTLPPLNEGQTITLPVGVCGYSVETGERDSLVRGTIDFEADSLAEIMSVAFQFTPVVELGGGDDTGG